MVFVLDVDLVEQQKVSEMEFLQDLDSHTIIKSINALLSGNYILFKYLFL